MGVRIGHVLRKDDFVATTDNADGVFFFVRLPGGSLEFFQEGLNDTCCTHVLMFFWFIRIRFGEMVKVACGFPAFFWPSVGVCREDRTQGRRVLFSSEARFQVLQK